MIASVGLTYENDVIKENLSKSTISPVTGENINSIIIPNLLAHDIIKIMNQTYIYMDQYQYNLKQWIKFYLKKLKIKLKHPYKKLIEEINYTTSLCLVNK